MRNFLGTLMAFSVGGGVVIACSSSTNTGDNANPKDGGTEATTTDSATTDAAAGDAANIVVMDAATSTEASVDADVGTVGGCTTFISGSDAGLTGAKILINSGTGWSPKCVQIHAGQYVIWEFLINSHELQPAGGTTPSPITPMTSAGITLPFPNAGTYGFSCATHPMETGAIRVVP